MLTYTRYNPQITHGGLTSAVFDETYGALLFNMRREGQAKFHRCGFIYIKHFENLLCLIARQE